MKSQPALILHGNKKWWNFYLSKYYFVTYICRFNSPREKTIYTYVFMHINTDSLIVYINENANRKIILNSGLITIIRFYADQSRMFRIDLDSVKIGMWTKRSDECKWSEMKVLRNMILILIFRGLSCFLIIKVMQVHRITSLPFVN